jgi:hypothetical protein
MVQEYFSGASQVPYIESVEDENYESRRHHHHHNDDDDHPKHRHDDDDDRSDDDSRHRIKTLLPSIYPVEQPSSSDEPTDSAGWFPWFDRSKPTHQPTPQPTTREEVETGEPSSTLETILPTLFSPTVTEPEPTSPSDHSIRLPPAIDIGKIRSIYPTIRNAIPLETKVVVRDDGEVVVFALTCLVAISIAIFYICSCYIRQLRKTWTYLPLEHHAFRRVSRSTKINHEVERDVLPQEGEDYKVYSYQNIE